jgi:hypothetical protein
MPRPARSSSQRSEAARPPAEKAPTAASVPEPKSSVVPTTSRKRLNLMRQERALAAGADVDPEVTARVRAWLKRMMRPPGE